jgi:hypothetical protein
MRFFAFTLAMLLGGLTAQAQSPELSIVETTKLIQKTRKTAVDPKGWAIDLLDVWPAAGFTDGCLRNLRSPFKFNRA